MTMCISNNKYVNAIAGLYTGGGAGSLVGGGDTKSRHPRRTFANAEGQTTIRASNRAYQGLLADPAAVQSLLSTGKAPKHRTLLGE
jgi:hypothetical protein